MDQGVKCSNFIGDTLDFALELGFLRILLIGHIGKLIKVAAGVMNTHSRIADARLETLSACALLAGADGETARRILGCTTTDDALTVVAADRLLEQTMKIALEKMLAHMRNRTEHKIQIEVVLFSNMHGILAMSEHAETFIKELKENAHE